MADKVLNLTLKYQGKQLDIAKYNRDFTKKFVIGSDKNIFWQILDKTFPLKHTFLTFSKGKYFIHLLKNMAVSIQENGAGLQQSEIEKYISNNKLTISSNTSGTVAFSVDWEIEYKFVEPYKYVPSKEVLADVKKYGRREPISNEQKFTTLFLIFGLLFTAIGLYIGSKNYEPPAEITFAERFQKAEQVATRMEVEVEDAIDKAEEDVPEVDVTSRRAETKEAAKEAVEQAQEVVAADFEEQFGLGFDENITADDTSIEGEIFEISQVSDIVVVTQGGGAGGSGAGGSGIPGSGSGSGIGGSGSGEFDFGSGGDLSGLGDGGGFGDLSGLSGGNLEGLDLGGIGGLEEIDINSIAGEIGGLKTTKIESKAQLQAAKKRFVGVKVVKEEDIELEEGTSQAKTEFAKITQIVNAYRPQIIKIYRVESMKYDLYGSVNITLYIESDGSVVAVEFAKTEGSKFTDKFLEMIRSVMLKWNISVKDSQIFEFRQKFVKQ